MSQHEKVYSLTPEEIHLLDAYRKAKKERHADIMVSIKDGAMVRLHWTHKQDLMGVLHNV